MLVVSPFIALMQDPAKKLPHVADIVPVMFLTEVAGLTAGDNGTSSWTSRLKGIIRVA